MFDYYIEVDDLEGLKDSLSENGITQEDLDKGLFNAAFEGKVEFVKEFLKHKANIDSFVEEHIPVLHISLQNSENEIARLLIERGANVNLATHSGWTPLHCAIEGEYDSAQQCGRDIDYSIINLLIEKGANLHAVNDEGISSIDLIEKYKLDGVKL